MYAILDDIKNRSLKKVYLLFGDERYLVKQYKERLIYAYTGVKSMSELRGDMNYLRLQGEDVSVEKITDFGMTFGFFANYRLIVVENSGYFDKGGNGEALVSFINALPDQTYIVFAEENVLKTSKLYKTVEKIGHCAEFKQMNEERIKQWIAKRAANEGKSITLGAANEIIKRIGFDMSDIATELEKLFCYCMDKEVIEKQDVMEIVTVHLSDHVFDMIAAMGRGDSKQALSLYYDLLGLKVPSMRILSLLIRQFNQLYLVRDLTDKGFDKRRIAEKTDIQLFIVDKCLGQISGFSLKGLRNALIDCAEYEKNFKTGNISEKLGLEVLLVKYSNKEERNN